MPWAASSPLLGVPRHRSSLLSRLPSGPGAAAQQEHTRKLDPIVCRSRKCLRNAAGQHESFASSQAGAGRQAGMASFSVPEVQDNAEGWGPASDAVPEHLKYLVRPPFVAPPDAFGEACFPKQAPANPPAVCMLTRAPELAAVRALLEERPGWTRVRVELRARPRAQPSVAAPRHWLWRAVAVCDGAGRRGGLPPR